jgi:hypothetical protein
VLLATKWLLAARNNTDLFSTSETKLREIPYSYVTIRRHAVALLVGSLRYKPEGHGFDSRWWHGDFSFTYSFRPHCDLGVDSASNRNEYQEYFLRGKGGRCVGLTTLPPCADCLEIWEPQPPGTLRVCPDLHRARCTLTVPSFSVPKA